MNTNSSRRGSPDLDSKPPLIVLAGPTASGKSDVAVHMAEALDTEIISADSVQVYRRFNIGTAKPSARLRERVRHHLVDCADPGENFTAVRFRNEAARIARRLWSGGRIPLVAGGTGLYIKALVEGLSCGIKVSPEVESEIERIAAAEGQSGLYERARAIDPEWTARIHPNDSFRVRRVIGVFMTGGKRMSDIFRQDPDEAEWDTLFIVLDPPRKVLHERIERRCLAMLESGWRDETMRLMKMGYNHNTKAMRSLGYKTLLEEAEGKVSRDDTARVIMKNTKAFAKRQLTWFRKVDNAIFIPVDEKDTAEELADRILGRDDVKVFLERHKIADS